MVGDFCRLCSSTKQVTDILKTNFDNFDNLTMCISFATGINIEKDDLTSRMVCLCCLHTVLIFHTYRVRAVANDKKLKEECGQTYVPPATNINEVAGIINKIDHDSNVINIVNEPSENKVIELLDTDSDSELEVVPILGLNNESQSPNTINNFRKSNSLKTNVNEILFRKDKNYNVKYNISDNYLKAYSYDDRMARLNQKSAFELYEIDKLKENQDVIFVDENLHTNLPQNTFKTIALASKNQSQLNATGNRKKFKQPRLDDLIRSLQLKTQERTNVTKSVDPYINKDVPILQDKTINRAPTKLNILSHYVITDSSITNFESLKNSDGNTNIYKHLSIHKLLDEHKNIIIPEELYDLDMAPKVYLDKNAINNWYITQVHSLTEQLENEEYLRNNKSKYLLRKRKFKRAHRKDDTNSEESDNRDFSSGSDDNYVDETNTESDSSEDENITETRTYKKIKENDLISNSLQNKETIQNVSESFNSNNRSNLKNFHLELETNQVRFENSPRFEPNIDVVQNNFKKDCSHSYLSSLVTNNDDCSSPVLHPAYQPAPINSSTTALQHWMTEMRDNNIYRSNTPSQYEQYNLLMQDLNPRKNPPTYEEWCERRKRTIWVKSVDELTGK